MVEFDPLFIAILVGMLGLAMWAVTNIHLKRRVVEIKADIDAKRAGTEAFVEGKLEDLRNGLKADLPKMDIEPHLEALKATFKSDLEALESRLKTVQIDAAPLLDQVQATLIPAVEAKVENVKSALLGHLGFAKKSVKALAEGAVEIVGERAVSEAGFENEWEVKLAQLGMDDPWLKEHKTVALGLEFIKEAMRGGQRVEIGASVPANAKRMGLPKGFR